MTSNSKGGDKKVPLIPLKRGIPQITVYIAICIEWKYKNDTSFDNGIHFHVNTMVLQCKCFLLCQLINDHIIYS